jgi:hypothetical protein
MRERPLNLLSLTSMTKKNHPSVIQRFRLVPRSEANVQLKRVVRQFVKGPIDLAWIQAASRCSGKAAQVGIALWYRSGLMGGSKVNLKCSNALLKDFGVARHSGYRALRRLEQAKLVKVLRGHGRCPLVSILDAPE